MTFIIDMNLSPRWKSVLKSAGIESVHWSETGELNAPDIEIFNYATYNNCAIITCDIDFTTILALTKAEKPSVILIRTKNILPEYFARTLISAINDNLEAIISGAIMVIDEDRMRIRILPLRG